jgi:hypothetical protein
MMRGHAQPSSQKIFVIGQDAMSPKPIQIAIQPNSVETLAEMLSIESVNVIANIKPLGIDGLLHPSLRP